MDYTKNHHLPQWVKSDRIMMDDFNQMCRDIEAGLNKTQSSASSGVTTVQNNLNAAEERLSAQIVLILKQRCYACIVKDNFFPFSVGLS